MTSSSDPLKGMECSLTPVWPCPEPISQHGLLQCFHFSRQCIHFGVSKDICLSCTRAASGAMHARMRLTGDIHLQVRQIVIILPSSAA